MELRQHKQGASPTIDHWSSYVELGVNIILYKFHEILNCLTPQKTRAAFFSKWREYCYVSIPIFLMQVRFSSKFLIDLLCVTDRWILLVHPICKSDPSSVRASSESENYIFSGPERMLLCIKTKKHAASPHVRASLFFSCFFALNSETNKRRANWTEKDPIP